MSTNSNSSRNAHNAGSDSAGRYGVHPVDAYKRSTLPTAPATREVHESAVKDMPQRNHPGSAVRDL